MVDEKQVMISVIIPVYNSEKYLHKCIDSVLAQSYTNFELILVNDGSTDGSGKICDEYAEKDERVRVFHKDNGGVSSARNIGLKNSSGDYIIHADSDDLMLSGALESLYYEAKQSNSDIVIGNYIIRYGSKDNFVNLNLTEFITSYDFLYGMLMGKYHGSLCNKLIKKTCYQNYLFYERVNYMEDTLMLSQIFLHNPSLAFIKNKVYVYIQREDSITNKPSLESIQSIEKVILRLENILKQDRLFDVPIEKMKLRHKTKLLFDFPYKKLHVTRFAELNSGILKRKYLPLRYRIILWFEFNNIVIVSRLYNQINSIRNQVKSIGKN